MNPFSLHSKLIFHNSIIDLANAKFAPVAKSNAKVYEGKDALRQLKKMEVDLPEDIDMEKAVGHQK